MPAIPGIIPLTYLIFAPNYAIRRLFPQDHSSATSSSMHDYTRLTGGLFGLGPQPKHAQDEEGQSVYRKHDVEVDFNVRIEDKGWFMSLLKSYWSISYKSIDGNFENHKKTSNYRIIFVTC